MSLKVLELFCGAGSFSLNLNSNNIAHEIVGFSDIRDSAIELFCKIHDKSPKDNLGDINDVSAKGLDVDLLVFGSPCQSFTREGKGGGGAKGSGTKSALMWQAVRIMKECTPKWIVWENVPDAVNKKNMPNFIEYMDELDDIGYNTYYIVLNAHELGSAQKRKRLFSVSVRKDIDNGEFKFEYDKVSPRKLSQYIDNVDDKTFDVEEKVANHLFLGVTEDGYKIKNGTQLGYLIANEGDGIDLGFYSSKTRRGRVQKGACQTLIRRKSVGIMQNERLRYLTPYEYWKLQELSLDMYKLVDECDFSIGEKYDVIGGMINQLHLDVVFKSLAKSFNWELNDDSE